MTGNENPTPPADHDGLIGVTVLVGIPTHPGSGFTVAGQYRVFTDFPHRGSGACFGARPH